MTNSRNIVFSERSSLSHMGEKWVDNITIDDSTLLLSSGVIAVCKYVWLKIDQGQKQFYTKFLICWKMT